MLNNILKLDGVQQLNKEQKVSLTGGENPDYTGDDSTQIPTDPAERFRLCLANCAGVCSYNGTCYQFER